MVKTVTKDDIFNLLAGLSDPEIPVVTIEEMGMLRDAIIHDEGVDIIITPTYTGCPAMGIIEQDIIATLHNFGIAQVNIKTVYSPAWTTDWMTEATKEKLRQYGIAPPSGSCSSAFVSQPEVACPQCSSNNTHLISQHGSTACKALYKCNDCQEPFDYFKCH
ncbi:MAG TPA: phenylacetate-CoA oxygenase subunit PaaJ [Chitinophagaceae bacterium]|nr:phenylacetate-CoA oxygenase subunit PaaJ [Chitinophagaceae bacterium]